MDKLSMAIIAMEAHVACSNDRLRQAWDIIHAKLVEENGSSHNSQSVTALVKLIDDNCEVVTFKDVQWLKRDEVVECLNVGVPTLHT